MACQKSGMDLTISLGICKIARYSPNHGRWGTGHAQFADSNSLLEISVHTSAYGDANALDPSQDASDVLAWSDALVSPSRRRRPDSASLVLAWSHAGLTRAEASTIGPSRL